MLQTRLVKINKCFTGFLPMKRTNGSYNTKNMQIFSDINLNQITSLNFQMSGQFYSKKLTCLHLYNHDYTRKFIKCSQSLVGSKENPTATKFNSKDDLQTLLFSNDTSVFDKENIFPFYSTERNLNSDCLNNVSSQSLTSNNTMKLETKNLNRNKSLFHTVGQRSYHNLSKAASQLNMQLKPIYSLNCPILPKNGYFLKSSSTINHNPKKLNSKIDKYMELMRIKNACECGVVTIPGIWGLAMLTPAGGVLSPILLAKFVAGGAAVLTTQCLMNDIIDLKIDRQVERTKNRPLANGDVSMKEAFALLSMTMSLGMAVLLTLPTECVFLGSMGVITMATYPFFKRFFPLPGLIIGLLNGIGIYMANIALLIPMNWSVVIPLHIAYIFWTFFYETVYSFQDYRDDVRIGIKSTAQFVGIENCKNWLYGVTTVTSLCLTAAGLLSEQTFPYYLAVSFATGVWFKQSNEFIPNQPYDVLKFFNINAALGVLIFFGGMLGTYFKSEIKDSGDSKSE